MFLGGIVQPNLPGKHRTLRGVARFNPEYLTDESRIPLDGPGVSGSRRGSMETTNMHVREAKARTNRKARPIDGGHKEKAARAAGKQRVPRDVKAKSSVKPVRPTIPANDTLPAELMDLPGLAGLPVDELGVEAVLGAAPSVE